METSSNNENPRNAREYRAATAANSVRCCFERKTTAQEPNRTTAPPLRHSPGPYSTRLSDSADGINGRTSGSGRGHLGHRTSWARSGGDQQPTTRGHTAPTSPSLPSSDPHQRLCREGERTGHELNGAPKPNSKQTRQNRHKQPSSTNNKTCHASVCRVISNFNTRIHHREAGTMQEQTTQRLTFLVERHDGLRDGLTDGCRTSTHSMMVL